MNNLPTDKPHNAGYHSYCYSSYTSVPSSITPQTPDDEQLQASHRSHRGALKTDERGVFAKVCTFCKKERKKVGEKAPPLTKCTLSSAEDLIKEAIRYSEDEDLKASLD